MFGIRTALPLLALFWSTFASGAIAAETNPYTFCMVANFRGIPGPLPLSKLDPLDLSPRSGDNARVQFNVRVYRKRVGPVGVPGNISFNMDVAYDVEFRAYGSTAWKVVASGKTPRQNMDFGSGDLFFDTNVGLINFSARKDGDWRVQMTKIEFRSVKGPFGSSELGYNSTAEISGCRYYQAPTPTPLPTAIPLSCPDMKNWALPANGANHSVVVAGDSDLMTGRMLNSYAIGAPIDTVASGQKFVVSELRAKCALYMMAPGPDWVGKPVYVLALHWDYIDGDGNWTSAGQASRFSFEAPVSPFSWSRVDFDVALPVTGIKSSFWRVSKVDWYIAGSNDPALPPVFGGTDTPLFRLYLLEHEIWGCAVPTPTVTSSRTSTSTRTATPTGTATRTASASRTATSTASPTATVTPTSTPSGTQGPSGTITPTHSISPTFTISRTFSASPTPTTTPTYGPDDACGNWLNCRMQYQYSFRSATVSSSRFLGRLQDGRYLVTEINAWKVLWYSADGSQSGLFFQGPSYLYALHVDVHGDVWVGSTGHLYKLDRNGDLLRDIVDLGTGRDTVGQVGRMTSDPQGNIYFVDVPVALIRKVTTDGALIWNSPQGFGDLFPQGLAYDRSLKRLYSGGTSLIRVWDPGTGSLQDTRVLAGTCLGQFQATLSLLWTPDGLYTLPMMAVDPHGVQRFTQASLASGGAWKVDTSFGWDQGMRVGMDMATDSGGLISVLDSQRLNAYLPCAYQMPTATPTLSPTFSISPTHSATPTPSPTQGVVEICGVAPACALPYLYAVPLPGLGQIGRLAVLPNGELLLVAEGKLYKASADGSAVAPYGPSAGYVSGVHVDGGGQVWVGLQDGLRYLGPMSLEFRDQGSGPAQFNYVSSISVAPDGSIYVADYGNGRVKKLDSAWSVVWSAPLQQTTGDIPWSLTFDSAHNQLLVGGAYNTLWALDAATGAVTRTFGGGGNCLGQAYGSVSVAMQPAGLVITEVNGHRGQRFKSASLALGQNAQADTTFGWAGSGAGALSLPFDVAVGPQGRVYVADHSYASGESRVVVYGDCQAPAAPPQGLGTAKVGGHGGQRDKEWPAFFVAPNPSRGRVKVFAPADLINGARVHLIDIGGQSLLTAALEPSAAEAGMALDISALANGVYWAVLEQDQGGGRRRTAIFKLALAR